jgi:hypothetical protein
MPNQTVEFDLEYTVSCPDCLQAGETVMLGFSAANGGILCQTGKHRFDEIPGGDKQASPEPKTGQEATIRVLQGNDTADPKARSREEIRDRINELTQDKMREAARKAVAPVTTIDKLPEPAPLPVVAGAASVAAVVPISANQLMVTIILSERHASAVRAEAENQRLSVEDYFQDYVSRCLDAEWT